MSKDSETKVSLNVDGCALGFGFCVGVALFIWVAWGQVKSTLWKLGITQPRTMSQAPQERVP